ncbi:hypothetical protein [Nostoc sp. FACHB-280]|uniref:hypothetical protein n=1 Tax=Nostoc sp. FACHB-280 TaxID=2692839 RepID=UPI00168AE108|nr:hypothetical protein [Nostoc sp. FACHB-280]MBD2496101.1 hypothetical protein [Nostoc sp. FACHB-280]
MKLKIKPIVNGLFQATLSYEEFEATAVGHTKDEATKKALEWLKREIELSYEIEKAESACVEKNEEFELESIEDELDDQEQSLYSGEFLNDEIWLELEKEVQKLAMQVAVVALKATLKYAFRASIGGSVGGLFF